MVHLSAFISLTLITLIQQRCTKECTSYLSNYRFSTH
jgi:hypothetical protein